MAGALAAAVAGARSYTRVAHAVDEGSTTGLEPGNLVPGSFGESDRYVVQYRDRSVVRGTLSVRNTSRVSVRVERVGRRFGGPGDYRGLVDFRPDLNLLDPPRAYGLGGQPFAPFTLHPGEERAVEVALWLDNCEYNEPGSGTIIEDVPVRYRALGMTFTVDVPLRISWEVHRGTTDICPRPQDRGP